MDPIVPVREQARLAGFAVLGHVPDEWQISALEHFACDYANERCARFLLLGVLLGALVPFLVWVLLP